MQFVQKRAQKSTNILDARLSHEQGCHTNNLAPSGLRPEACLQQASTILWTQAELDIFHGFCYNW